MSICLISFIEHSCSEIYLYGGINSTFYSTFQCYLIVQAYLNLLLHSPRKALGCIQCCTSINKVTLNVCEHFILLCTFTSSKTACSDDMICLHLSV